MGRSVYSANLIFDLGGVLLEKSSLQSMRSIGLTHFIGPFNVFDIERKLFSHLHKLKPLTPNSYHAYYKNTYPLPQIFCDWLAGFISSKDLLTLINNYFNHQLTIKKNKRELKLLRAIAQLIFTPEKMAKIIVPCKAGVKILKKCHQERSGTLPKHKIFILTNWDAESFPLLYQHRKIRAIFNKAEDIVVSSIAHLIKPDPRLFNLAFEQFGIDPDKELTIYIDDEWHNIKAAQSLGKKQLHCIHCKNSNFKHVYKELVRLGIVIS